MHWGARVGDITDRGDFLIYVQPKLVQHGKDKDKARMRERQTRRQPDRQTSDRYRQNPPPPPPLCGHPYGVSKFLRGYETYFWEDDGMALECSRGQISRRALACRTASRVGSFKVTFGSCSNGGRRVTEVIPGSSP